MRRLADLLEHTDLVAVVPEYAAEIFAAGHRVRPVRLPFRTELIEVALYTRHESSRNASQRWVIGFMADILGTPVCPARLPPLTSRSA